MQALQPDFDSKIHVKTWTWWYAFAMPTLERKNQADPRGSVANQSSSRSVKDPVLKTK